MGVEELWRYVIGSRVSRAGERARMRPCDPPRPHPPAAAAALTRPPTRCLLCVFTVRVCFACLLCVFALRVCFAFLEVDSLALQVYRAEMRSDAKSGAASESGDEAADEAREALAEALVDGLEHQVLRPLKAYDG